MGMLLMICLSLARPPQPPELHPFAQSATDDEETDGEGEGSARAHTRSHDHVGERRIARRLHPWSDGPLSSRRA